MRQPTLSISHFLLLLVVVLLLCACKGDKPLNPDFKVDGISVSPIGSFVGEPEPSDQTKVVTVDVNEVISFTDASTGGPSKNLTRRWSFGDGSTESTNDEAISHIYTKPGLYKVEMCLTNLVCLSKYVYVRMAAGNIEVDDFEQPVATNAVVQRQPDKIAAVAEEEGGPVARTIIQPPPSAPMPVVSQPTPTQVVTQSVSGTPTPEVTQPTPNTITNTTKREVQFPNPVVPPSRGNTIGYAGVATNAVNLETCKDFSSASGTLKLKPKQLLRLMEVTVYSSQCGSIQVTLSGGGLNITERFELAKNKCRLAFSSIDGSDLQPGTDYELSFKTSNSEYCADQTAKLLNAAPCGKKSIGDAVLGLEDDGSTCFFKLKYQY